MGNSVGIGEFKVEVLNIGFGKGDDETAKAWENVVVSIRGKDNEKTDISVELYHGRYRPDLGALITTSLGYAPEKEDLDDYGIELEELLRVAEDYSASIYRMEPTGIAENYVFLIFREKVVLTEVRHSSTSRQKEFRDIKTFEPLKEAKEFLETLLKRK